MTKQNPSDIFSEYDRLRQYNDGIGLYDDVSRNENFFVGRQWEGVNAPKGLDLPVFNMMKRVVSYFIANIVSDDVTQSLSLLGQDRNDQNDITDVVSKEIDQVIELTKAKAKNRDAIRNAAVDGDACFYLNFNPNAETGQTAKGEIEIEVLDNTNVLFGNPQLADLQKQPYLIIISRRTLESVRNEARLRNLPDTDGIISDDAPELLNEGEWGKVTVLSKLWRENGTVHITKVTKNTVLLPDTDLRYKLYPLAWFSWDKVKNCYHGQAAISGLVPNQIFVNKLFAMAMRHVQLMAFPKVIYNRNLFPDGWDNSVGACVGVRGDPTQAVAGGFKAPDMSSQVMDLIDRTISNTRDAMGATDAALGNVRPDNTSAIIAVQQAAAMPLEIQKMNFYQFVEDYIRVIVDMMRVNYGVRTVSVKQTLSDGTTQNGMAAFDFSVLNDIVYRLNIDVGASSYWSQIVQIQTLDNLFKNGILTDPIVYLESVPDSYIKNRQAIIDACKQQAEPALMRRPAGGEAG